MNSTIGIILSLIAIGGPCAILAVAFFGEPSGRDRSRWHNVAYGRWRVRYPDGKISEPMMKDVARDYAKIFGGRVISAREDQQ